MALKVVGGRKVESIPPTHPPELGAAGRELWTKLVSAYALEDEGGMAVLAVACRAADREETCRAVVAKQGMTVKDRFRQVRPHPLLAVERAARAQVLTALRQLALPIPED